MKHYLLSLSILLLSVHVAFAGNGSEADPLSVSDVKTKTDGSSTTYWVRGYVVGEMGNYSNSKYFYEMAPPFAGTATFLLADSPEEYDLSKCITIQFPGSALVDNFNLEENPQFWKQEIAVCGMLRDYINMKGVKSISEYKWTNSDIQINEASKWNFYENFDSRDYNPTSSSSIFAGGVYVGETGAWKFSGATYGDTGNDNKWGSASARLRLTESTSGDAGYVQMQFDKTDGIGELRFWAGNYKEDAAKSTSVSVYVSTNGGTSWSPKITAHSIIRGNNVTTNGMSEYRFYINITGNVRIRIAKGETGTAGLNIDNIRMSDYKVTSGTTSPEVTRLAYYCTREGLFLNATNTANVKVFDLTGKLIENKNINDKTFIPLRQGAYVVRCGAQTFKIVI